MNSPKLIPSLAGIARNFLFPDAFLRPLRIKGISGLCDGTNYKSSISMRLNILKYRNL